MPHVVLLLKSDVDDSLRDVLAKTVQEFSLPDNDFQFRSKVHVVGDILSFRVNFFDQDGLLEQCNGKVSILLVPLIEELVFILSV